MLTINQALPRVAPWLVIAVATAAPAVAQTDVEMIGRRMGGTRPPASYFRELAANPRAFEFSGEGGWVRRALRAAEAQQARRVRTPLRLPGPVIMSGVGMPVVSGDLNMPVLLVVYANTDSAATALNMSRDTMQFRLFGTHDPNSCSPLPCYSVNSYYDEISAGNISVNGTVVDWVRVGSDDTFYEGGPECNGLGSCGHVNILISEAVFAADSLIDFGQFDNDGPDNIPNSIDDDGYVDALVIIHPEIDGACGGVVSAAADNIWAHRSVVLGVASSDSSNSPAGGTVRIRDYIIQGGQGGNQGCTANEPQSMGIVAHETGHVWWLPDLYDTSLRTGGIGDWGLMSTGNFNEPNRPAHMMAWSRAKLGWITEVLISDDTTMEISPIEVSDTAFVLPIAGTNEYFLLENRQRIGSDAELWGPGLLVWHIDSVLVDLRSPPPLFINFVNATQPHGIVLEQADGRDDLSSGPNSRGDAADPFPGSLNRTRFGPTSNPNSDTNAGVESGILIDSIAEVAPSGPIRVAIVFSRRTLITASDTFARFDFDSVPTTRVDDFLDNGDTHTLSMDAVQVTPDSLRRLTWLSWSNAQTREHAFTSSAKGDTIVADVDTDYWLQAIPSGPGGSVVAVQPVDPTGEFLDSGTTVTLVAELIDSSYLFEGWTGTVTSANDTLMITMNLPHVLTALFGAPLIVDAPTAPGGVMGASYSHQLVASGGLGTFSWTRVTGTIPPGVSLFGTGLLSGILTDTGTFTFDAEVASGSQRDTVTVGIAVTPPTLALDDVVDDILGVTDKLSPQERTFLDLIGNQNGVFDVGDFLAWVESTGQMAALMQSSRAAELVRGKP